MSGPAPGNRVLKGKYELIRTLGEGGMGEVHLARHLLLEQPVAVKMLNPSSMNAPAAVERFLREARALAAVRHPCVCQVFDVDTEGGLPFIVMEYLEGWTLMQAVTKQPTLPLEERVRWIVQAAEGLAAAHDKGIVHRDVKPNNLMVTADGSVRVVDFGVAKRREDATRNLTGDAAIGTLNYMAPEQLLGHEVDARSDVWALAVTLYQLLSRALPFEGDSLASFLNAILTQPPVTLDQRGMKVPAGLWACLSKALQPQEQRTPHMRAFAEQLRPFAKPEPMAYAIPHQDDPYGATLVRAAHQPADVTEPAATTPEAPALATRRDGAAAPSTQEVLRHAAPSKVPWVVAGGLLSALLVVGGVQVVGSPAAPAVQPQVAPAPSAPALVPVVEARPAEPVPTPAPVEVQAPVQPLSPVEPAPPPAVDEKKPAKAVKPPGKKPKPADPTNPEHL